MIKITSAVILPWIYSAVSSSQEMLLSYEGCSALMGPFILAFKRANACNPRPESDRVVFEVIFGSNKKVAIDDVVAAAIQVS